MNKSIVAIAVAGLVGAVGFTSVAAAAEGQLYGSLRAGVISGDDDLADSGNKLDLGGTGNNGSVGGQGLYSRVGVKGEADLGNGASAGFKVERSVDSDELGTRHHNVWIGGSWGKLTLGQQDNPYRSARHWDQSWFLGGQFGYGDGGSRIEGIRYDVASGPFNLAIMATANDAADDESAGVDAVIAVDEQGVYDVADNGEGGTVDGANADTLGTVTVPIDRPENANQKIVAEFITQAGVDAVPAVPAESNDGVDSWVIAAGYDIGPVTLNVAHRTNEADNAGGRSSDNTAIGLNGGFGQVGWYLAYQTSSDNVGEEDVDSIGGFVSFAASERDTLYFYHVSHDADLEASADPSETILGYSHSFGGGVTFIGEYLTLDNDTDGDGSDPNVLALALKVDF